MLFDLLLLCLLISSVWGCKKKQDYYNIIMILIFYIFLDKVVRKKKHGNKLIEGVPSTQDRLTAWVQDKWPSLTALIYLIYTQWSRCVKEQTGALHQLASHGRGILDSRGASELGRFRDSPYGKFGSGVYGYGR